MLVVDLAINAVSMRRRVDWPVILGTNPPAPSMLDQPGQAELASLLSAFDELLTLDDTDKILRRAVELARERIGFPRAGLFLLDETRNVMLGTWGTDLDGNLVDERHVMYDLGENDRKVFRRADAGTHFTIIENCPIVVQLPNETRVVGRGWVSCIPIRSARARIGMLFNDAGSSGAPVDEAQQARGAVLCSLLGTVLDLRQDRVLRGGAVTPSARHPMIVEAVRLLAKDPSLAGTELAERLRISPSRLARVFKAELGMSLVEYRNRLRLERFQVLVDSGGENLLGAALAAGFGSYAQFHRVFRALRGASPRASLGTRGRPRSRPPAAPDHGAMELKR